MKNIIKIISFFFVFIILFSLFNFLFSSKNINLSDRKKKEFVNGILMEKEGTVDVLFVGDSLVYSGISPLNLWNDYGYSSYNISLVAQRLYQTYDNLKVSLEYQKPKIVFLDASVLNYSFGISKVLEVDLINKFDFLKYHDIWKDAFGESNKILRAAGNVNNKGFRYSLQVESFEDSDIKYEKIELNNLSMYLFDEIVNICNENDIKLVIINIPTKLNWNSESHDIIEDFLVKYNLEYYDLNNYNLIDWNNDTRDKGEHLNYYGAKKVSAYLGEYIKNTGLVEDHRGDKKYASWQEAYDKMADKLF